MSVILFSQHAMFFAAKHSINHPFVHPFFRLWGIHGNWGIHRWIPSSGVAHFTILLSEISPERLALMPGILGSWGERCITLPRGCYDALFDSVIFCDLVWHASITSNPFQYILILKTSKSLRPRNWMISNDVIHFIRSGPQSTHGCKSPARVCLWTGEVVPTPNQCALADLARWEYFRSIGQLNEF